MAPPGDAPPPHKKRRYGEYGFGTSTQDESFGVQSLPVGILADDFSGEPADGQEYLAVVRREAAAAPCVFLAAHNPYAETATQASRPISAHGAYTAHDPISSCANAGQEDDGLCMPSTEWKTTFVRQFKNAREAISNPPLEPVRLTRDDLPKISNTSAWYAWIHGRPPPPTSPEEAQKQSAKKYEWRIREPSASVLLRLSTEQILALLEAFPYWIAHRVIIPDSQIKASEREGAHVLQPLHARWLFALMLRLDARLVSEEISTLRTLARACIAAITLSRIRRKAVRSRINKAEAEAEAEAAAAAEAETETDAEGVTVTVTVATPQAADAASHRNADEKQMRKDEAGAWMVVAIVAGVWGQSDLWDDAIGDMRRVT